MAEIEWICSACLYVRPRPGADPDELGLLTIVNGQLVCARHAGCASGTHHDTIMAAVFLESGVERMSLDAYQDWRGTQPDDEQGV